MQAIRVHQFGGLDSLVLEDVPRPSPGEGEVLLRVKAAGVGPWDALVRSGRSVLPQPLPLTPGSDVDRPLRIGRDLQVGTVWVNDWVMMRDEFEEGGYKQSGRGRLRGLAALDDFLEYKHIVLKPGVVRPD